MPYKSYTTEDFVLDKEFRGWVVNPDTESNQYWKEWLDNNPDKSETIKSAIGLVHTLPVEQNSLTSEEILVITKNIEDAIDSTNEQNINEEKVIPINPMAMAMKEGVKERKAGYFRIVKIAASILLLMTLSFLLYDNIDFNSGTQQISKSEIITKENPKGQKSTIHLKDGSTVILNSNSKVSYPVEFSSSERVIELEGEAYFEVAKDANRHFRVKTANTVTTALGTTFNIDAFGDEDEVQISLTSGEVEVQKLGADVAAFTLKPGQGVIYSRSSQNMIKRDIDVNRVLAWTTKELIFEDDNIQEVIKRLERWYGVEISMENKIEGVLSANFSNESLKAVLEGISYSFSLDYEMSDKKVILKSKQ